MVATHTIDGAEEGERSPQPTWLSRPALVVGALVGVVAVPLLVALVVLHDPRWLAMSDVAEVEMSVRDVGQGQPPLVGLGGRMQGYGEWGSHPGPLSFYALAPVYWLLGSDGWALLASAAVLATAAAGVALWLGYRRGGWQLALALTGVLLVLMRAYGAETVVEPWNPHLPLMWWLVFLLAVWSVLCRDFVALPIVVVAGTFCAQTHIPYLASVAGLGLLATVVVARRLWVERGHPPGERRLPVRWLVAAGALAGLLWLPPLVDQLVNDPGNLAIILENFRHPYDEQIAFGDAFERWLARLDVVSILRADLDGGDLGPGGSVWFGAAFLAGWAASASVAWRRRDQALISLHLTVGIALGLGLVATTRIFGIPYPYLMLWAWGTTALAMLAVLWTWLSSQSPEEQGGSGDGSPTTVEGGPVTGDGLSGLRWPRQTVPVVSVVAALALAVFVVDAAAVEMPDAPLSQALGELSSAAADRLAEDPVGCGADCTYLVTTVDPIHLGSQGYGMLLELEKRGFDVRMAPHEAVSVGDHRVIEPAEADARVHVTVTDAAAEGALADDGSEQLAFVDRDDGYEPSAVFLVRP